MNTNIIYFNKRRKICTYYTKEDDDMSKILTKIRDKTATQILNEYADNKIPINIENIVKKLGIQLIPDTFKDMEDQHNEEIWGLVLAPNDTENADVGIFYKSSINNHKKRFTIAHELGHCCLHGDILKNGYIEYRKSMNSDDEHEIEANIFAGQLLIPEDSLSYIIQRLIKPSLRGLAEIFDVSVQVMRARLEYLEIDYYDDQLEKMIYV